MIEINNLTTSRVEGEFLKRVAEKVLKGENRIRVDLSVALVGEGRIKELNKKYRGKNRTTDVLAFGENTKYPAPKLSVRYGAGKIQDTKYKIQDLGEIVICLREVKKNVKKFDSTFEKELARVLIHGILHLLGEDHETSELKTEPPKEAKVEKRTKSSLTAKKMEEKQENYLKLFFR